MKNGNAFVLNNTFIDVPGVSTDPLAAAHANGTLQNIVPGVNTTNGVAFVPNAAGNGSTVFFPGGQTNSLFLLILVHLQPEPQPAVP
jgi:hypothetical protein